MANSSKVVRELIKMCVKELQFNAYFTSKISKGIVATKTCQFSAFMFHRKFCIAATKESHAAFSRFSSLQQTSCHEQEVESETHQTHLP